MRSANAKHLETIRTTYTVYEHSRIMLEQMSADFGLTYAVIIPAKADEDGNFEFSVEVTRGREEDSSALYLPVKDGYERMIERIRTAAMGGSIPTDPLLAESA